MTWEPNRTIIGKNMNVKSNMYAEYNNLIKELEQYMPQFKASMKDLQEPSQTFVTNFYTDVFSEFFCDVNNLTEIQVTQNLTYNEMYGETVPILNMCIALRYIYSKLGIDDFGLNDICDPSPKRTYRLLQTMINFIKYSDEKISEADAQMKAVRNMKEKIDNLRKQKDNLKETINQKSLHRKQRGTEIKSVADEGKNARIELMDIQKSKEEILKELDKVKQEQESVEKQCSLLSEQRDNIIRDINSLRNQIVEAPDLLKADLERLKRMKNEVTEKKTAMMGQVSAKKQTVITLEQELSAQEKRLRLLTDITEKNDRLLKINQEIETMLQEKSESLELSEDLKEKIDFAEHERANINNKITNILKDMEFERNAMKSKYDLLEKELEEKIKYKNNHYESIKLLENEISRCSLQRKQLEEDVQIIMQSFETTKHFLLTQQNEYTQEIFRQLQKMSDVPCNTY
ncbi:uncharacterized protein LOC126895507 [Daktulosphaira vitifoliae]|uniref:uncharacterized protein LOC126895507 n=1 Tax=Daktulosphaira vitifoliae TaxID=58002 RepID=UPI0021AAFA5E|nr:uncharacterized protein LOC126895507 [Daktulosphaira vitifoliae]